MTATPFEIADALDDLAADLDDLLVAGDILRGTRETVRYSDSQIIGWIDNYPGCENEKCIAAIAAGRLYHATPFGVAATLPDYHFETATDARLALVVRHFEQQIHELGGPSCFRFDAPTTPATPQNIEAAARNLRQTAARMRQEADDAQRAADEGDEQRDYAEERANAELLDGAS